MSAPSVSRDFTQAVFDYLAIAGHPAEAVMASAGLDVARLLPSGRVHLGVYERLFEAGERLTGDDCFGLNMGASPYPQSWGLVSHLAVSAPDAMTAASALMDYSELQLNFVRFRVSELSDSRLCMELHHDGVDRLSRHVAEHLLANIAVLASTQIGYTVPELRMELAHDYARSAERLSRLINAPVTINADRYRIEAAPQFLEQRALYGEEDLYRVTEALARERLMELRGEDRFLNSVRETVLQQLPGGLPKVIDVANSLQMSARTLQRRLQERNLRYQQVLDEVRGELALQLITDASLSLNDMADYLGFNDQSALQHAFRRWHGTTPGKYRRRALGAGFTPR
ncbi:MAG: AraC family transcriptional regulator ligand-binding domain-containing protein [Halioglobus sp.]|nr:AraC family transcriptional regulator ligand-binding domain-containing protein [Halioglobus sp.]